MDAIERLLIEADCTRLMTEFANCSDTFDYDRAVELFVPDCRFSRADEVFEGQDGLRFALSRRPLDRMTRHIVSNVLIDIASADTASGTAYSLVFGYRGKLEKGAEAPLGGPDSLIHYNAEFTRTGAGWRIATWHIGLAFRKVAV